MKLPGFSSITAKCVVKDDQQIVTVVFARRIDDTLSWGRFETCQSQGKYIAWHCASASVTESAVSLLSCVFINTLMRRVMAITSGHAGNLGSIKPLQVQLDSAPMNK